MEVKLFEFLPKEAIDIRTDVFMKEQGFQNEFDDTDQEAVHIVLMLQGRAAATCRVYFSKKNESYMIGRVAVRKEYRGQKMGQALVREAENYICARGGRKAMLFAQQSKKAFYEKQGYVVDGCEGAEEGCPHVMMEKEW